MKKRMARIFAAALAAVFLVLMIPFGASAVNLLVTTTPSEADEGYVYSGWTDVPLLVVKINYRPEGQDPVLLKTTDDTYWYEMLFGDGAKSMKSYFETISDGNFRFTPAKENYVNAEHQNVANDGIVEVTVNMSHPGSTNRNEIGTALNAAAEFVDFKSFDVNGDGRVGPEELAIAFIAAGYEETRSGYEVEPRNHAFYMAQALTAGGISMTGGYIKVGEMMNDSSPLTVGTFCHELSHYLGAVDLYTNKSWGGANSPAGKVSVMAGNGSAGKNDGEHTGESPSYLDAYHLTHLNFYNYTTVGDGEYTLYSRQSTEGKFNILRINTPNPNEYYLIENRYFDDSTEHFDSDTNYDGTRGVIIWHVDDNYAPQGNNGSDIGIAALAPRKEGGDLVFPANSGVFGIKGQVFDCTDYAFPWSETWHTSVGEVWNDYFQLKIEILTDANHEMKIKVSGTKTGDFPTSTRNTTPLSTSVTMSGQVTDLHGKTLKGVTVQIFDNYDYQNMLKSEQVQLDTEGKYAVVFQDLTPKTLYYTRVVYEMADGEFYYEDSFTTKNVSDPTICQVSFFRGLTDNDKAYAQKINAGEPIIVKFPMSKDGYVFAGWYSDPNFTNYYEVSEPCEAGELILWARWVEEDKAAKLNISGATLVNDKVDPAGYGVVGETFREPVVKESQEGMKLVWYADSACTTKFDFTKIIESTDAVTIYAKWEEDIPEETTGTSPIETTEPIGTTSPADTGDKDGISTSAIVVIVIVAVAVVAVIVFLAVKKKKK